MSRIWHVHGEETMCVVLTLSLIHILPAVMPNPYLIGSHARALAGVPDSCQSNELCLIPIILWQMPPCAAILCSRECEQNGCILVQSEWRGRSSLVSGVKWKRISNGIQMRCQILWQLYRKVSYCCSLYPPLTVYPLPICSLPLCL